VWRDEVAKLLVVHFEKSGVKARGRLCEHATSPVRYAEVAPTRRLQQFRLDEIRTSPSHAVHEQRLGTTRQLLVPLFRRERELIRECLYTLAERVFLAVICQPQERKHDRLIIGDCHGPGIIRRIGLRLTSGQMG
jgi:hypothetical protein